MKKSWQGVIAVAMLVATATGQFGRVEADVGDIGHEGPSYSGASGSHPTQEKPESKLWHHDGLWWGSMWSNSADAFTVHRLDRTSDTWVDTGTVLETTGNYRQDALFDGSKLYVASHRYATSSGSATARLTRLSYNSGPKTWSIDDGFPTSISNERSETLTIDKDSIGRLWATWITDAEVWVNHTNCSTTCDDTSWATPFTLDSIGAIGNAANTDVDDISAVVAFDGKIGVFWSNQSANADYFAIHDDGDGTSNWSLETALSGTDEADDHINIATDGSNVFVAVKTSHDSSSEPETYLLKRTPSGTWTAAETTDGGDRLTRPIVTYDQLNDELHWFGADVSGGKVYTKSSPAASPSFSSGKGDAVMWDASSDDMNDPTSTKQAVDPSTGLVVLATDNRVDRDIDPDEPATHRYWHHDDALGGASGIVAGFTATPQFGEAPLDVQFTDTSIGDPTEWDWDFGDGGSSTDQSPLHTYDDPGIYPVELTVTGAAGSDIEVKTNYIEVIAPLPLEATFTVEPSEGAAPLNVQFTDMSPGTPTSWTWDFGDGSPVSTAQNPTHVYNSIGTYDVMLSVTNENSESDSTTVQDAVVVTDEVTLTPVADAFVRDERPSNNYGDEDYLRLRNASSTYRSLVKFDVQGAGGDPTTATLRMFVDDGSPHAGNLYLVDDDWTESGVTGGNAPIPGTTPDAIGGEAVEGTWHEWDVTGLISGDFVSFMLITDSGNSAYFSSKEGLNPPELVITSAATQALSAEFSADRTTVEVGQTVTFSDLSTGVPATWNWNFGDGNTSDQPNPTHVYTTAGTYPVALTVDDGGGGNSFINKPGYITVTAPLPLAASFELDAPSGVAPHIVNFTDTSTGVPSTWNWSFGDGGTSTEQHPQHTYATPGTFTVTLTVGDGTDTDAAAPVAVTVGADSTVTAAADAHFRSDRPDRNYGSEDHVRIRQASTEYRSLVRFDVASIPTTVTSATVRMYVNDGSPSAGDLYLVDNGWSETGVDWDTQPPIGSSPVATGGSADAGGWHEWDVTSVLSGASAGSFSFTIVSGSHNSAYYSSREGANPPQLVVEGVSGPPPAPTAAFSGSPLTGSPSLDVNFTDESTGSPIEWEWDFGDGSPVSTAQNPSHTYAANGSYEVTLTATNGSGSDVETKTAYVVVSDPPPPVAAFSGTPLAGSAPLPVQFTDQSTGSPTEWLWDFGDGSPVSTAQNPSHTYAANGSYEVTLTATNGFGSDAEVKTAYVVVSDAPPPPAPVAAFSGTPLAGSASLTVQFTDESTGSPTDWLWNFGDGTTSPMQSPSHTYTSNGSYTVTLRATNAGGFDEEIKTAYVVVSDPSSGPETFTAVADAYVKTDRPDKNYGGDTWLRLRQASSVYESLVTFEVTGLSGAPTSAVLRLFVTDDSPSAGAVSSVDPAGWDESSVTWDSRPATIASIAPDQDAPAAGQWVEWDVTAALSGSGPVSFSLAGTSGNSVYFSSREGDNPPQLVVTP